MLRTMMLTRADPVTTNTRIACVLLTADQHRQFNAMSLY